MKKTLLAIFQSLVSTCLLLLLLEGAFFILGFPQGASDFIERATLQQNLGLRKPSGQYRIFVYGESTVQGAGYAPFSSPVKWLERYLNDFLPGRDIKVINFGRLGEGSAFIAQAFRDTLQYKPDLAIFYLGHNTFYPENRVEFVRKQDAPFTHRLRQWFHRSRLISAIARETIKFKIKRRFAKTEDTLMGDPRIETTAAPYDGIEEEKTLPGSPLSHENVRFFKENIKKIMQYGKERRVPVLCMKPVCNLKDYSPNLSSHLKTLSAEELTQWDLFYQKGREALKENDDLRALDSFEKAFAIDSTYADLSFFLGQIYFQKGDIGKARSFFEQARDHDGIIRRAPKDILLVFEDLTREEPLRYWDTEKAFISKTPGGISGWPFIEDNVHFSIEGQALVGRALADEIAKNNWIAPRFEWRFDRERPMMEIRKELGITDKTVFLNYSLVFNYLGHRYDKRLEFAQKAHDLFPEDPTGLRQFAWAYWLLGEKNMALDVYKDLAQKDPAALKTVFRAQPAIKRAYEASASPPENA